MKLQLTLGATSNILQVFVRDSSSTTGAGLAGLAFNTASLVAYYHRDTDTTATAITLVTMTVGTFTSSGFKEIDATNMPGWYQFCPPNAAVASGAKNVAFHLKGATNMAPLPLEVQLLGIDLQDAVRAGLTALPNVASGSAGAIPTTGTGANQISVSSGQVILQTGTGTGQLDFTSGVVKANTTQLAGQTVTAAAGVTFPTSVASPTNITAGTITTVTNLTNAPTVGDFTAAMKTSLNASTPASITGAVGSVTGNVGGSVGSVVATVSSNIIQIAGSTPSANNIARSTQAIALGTVGVGSSTTSIVTSSIDPTTTVADQFKGRIVTFDRATTTAALQGQATDITANTSGGVLTVTALTTAPANTDTFTIT